MKGRRGFERVAVVLYIAALAIGLVSGAGIAAPPTTYRDEVLADNPVSYWRFDEASGTTAADEKGLNSGTYAGGVILAQPGAIPSAPASTAATFDGVDDAMTTAASSSLGMSSAVTVELWVKRTRSGVFQAIVGKPTHGQSKLENYSLWFQPSNAIRMYVGNGTTYAQATTAAIDTNWHHIVGTFNNATLRLYVDGVQTATANTTVALTPNTNPFYVAMSTSSSTNDFGGRLDELAVYNTVLSPARVLAHYNKAFADLVPPTVTLAQPANGSSSTSSTVAFNGTAGNAPGDSSTVSVKVYAGASATGSPSQTLTATRQANNSYSVAATVPDGQWTARAEQTDTGGNTGESTANTFVVDTAAPTTTITTPPANPSNQSGVSIPFTASESAIFACRLDGGGFASCSSPASYSGLADGSHTFQVRATDSGGNTGPTASTTWTVDTVAPPMPAYTARPPDPSGSTSADFSFTDTEPGVAFLCQLDDGGFSACTSPKSYSALALGTHTFEVKARDLAGNMSAANSHTWTIDALPPPPPTITSGPADPSSSTDASFSFTDVQPAVTFECRLDGGTFEPCTSPKSYSDLTEGSHGFSVRAVDGSGTPSAPTSYPWVIVTAAPPSPTITSSPPDPSSSTNASFRFTSSQSGVTFLCQLDSGPETACTSPKNYSGLTDGGHTFRVKARDGAGNESGPTTHTWVVDTTAPTGPTISSHPPDPSSSRDASFGFESAQAASFECELDTGGFSACTSPKTYADLADGSHTFRVRAKDAAGNTGPESSFTWLIVTAPPATPSITLSPSDPSTSTSATFAFTSSQSGVSFLCQLDSGAEATCTSPKNYSGLSEGSHTFRVKARDDAGNTSAPASHTWVVDTVAPSPPTINSRPPNPSNDPSPSFGFVAEAGATLACEIDTGGFAACTSPASYSGLDDGSHTFRVRATDAAGNTGSAATYTWTIDVVPPATPSITSGPPDLSNTANATFTLTGPPGASLLCQLDTGAFATCTSPKSYSGLAEGSHTFSVKAQDAAGNESAAATRTWSVDTVAPTTTLLLTPTNPSNSTTAVFNFTAGETATFQCKLDGGAFVACTSPRTYTSLTTGSHTFQIKATDQAGNGGPTASYTWSIDATAPTITLTSPSNGGSTSSTQPSFAGVAGIASGDSTTVTVKIYAGSAATGSPVQTLTTTRGAGGSYSVGATSPLSPGTYTARAEQNDAAGNTGLSSANTFAVSDPVMLTAGDIAECGASGTEATALLLDSYPDAIVQTLGDNTYPNGTVSEFTNCYEPTWGRAKARTRPALGDHEYGDGINPNATGYFSYFQPQLAPFGAAATDPTRGWYSYNVGAWHVAVLNADCGTGDGSIVCSQDQQEQWFRSDLAANQNLCTIAVVHEPRWSSGSVHGSTAFVQRYWAAAYESGVDVVLSGSDHIYERFAPQDADGDLDTGLGVREFIVGTGGASKYSIGTVKANSEVRNVDAYGVLKLTLHPTSYDWQFVAEAGKTFTDSGTTACHGTPPPPPPEIPQVRSSSSNAGNAVTSLAIAKPAGTVQGDLLVATVAHQSGSNRNMTPPAGWTAIPGTDVFEGSNARIHGWYRVAGASEPDSYTFTLTGGSDGRDTAGGIMAISGANQATPINVSNGQSNGSTPSSSLPAASITTTVPNTLLIYAGSGSTAATYTAPGNMTERFDRTTSGTYKISVEAATQPLTNSGATGTRTALASTSVRSVTVMIAVRPQ